MATHLVIVQHQGCWATAESSCTQWGHRLPWNCWDRLSHIQPGRQPGPTQVEPEVLTISANIMSSSTSCSLSGWLPQARQHTIDLLVDHFCQKIPSKGSVNVNHPHLWIPHSVQMCPGSAKDPRAGPSFIRTVRSSATGMYPSCSTIAAPRNCSRPQQHQQHGQKENNKPRGLAFPQTQLGQV